jgi:hypothetical protein
MVATRSSIAFERLAVVAAAILATPMLKHIEGILEVQVVEATELSAILEAPA